MKIIKGGVIAAITSASALLASGAASAASVPQGTFGRVDGTAYLAAYGPKPFEMPRSSAITKFTPQTGSESETSFAITETAPSVFTILWTGRPDVHSKYLASDFRGGVEFSSTPDLWKYSGGQLTDLRTGRKLCLGPTFGVTGSVSTVLSSSACTSLIIVSAP